MLGFLAEVCEQKVHGSGLELQHRQWRAACSWGMARMIYVMDKSGRFLDKPQRDDFAKGWDTFSQTYQALGAEAQASQTCMWKFRPKLHDLCHLAMDVINHGINPRHRCCLGDEDLMGKCAKTGRKVHRGAMNLGFLRRHLLRLAVRWSERRRTGARKLP